MKYFSQLLTVFLNNIVGNQTDGRFWIMEMYRTQLLDFICQFLVIRGLYPLLVTPVASLRNLRLLPLCFVRCQLFIRIKGVMWWSSAVIQLFFMIIYIVIKSHTCYTIFFGNIYFFISISYHLQHFFLLFLRQTFTTTSIFTFFFSYRNSL